MKYTTDKLKSLAQHIEYFRSLEPYDQEWLEPLLGSSILILIEMLDLISDEPLTYEEISRITDLNARTVKAILITLKQGGCHILLDKTKAFAPQGAKKPQRL